MWGNHKYAELDQKMVKNLKQLGQYDALKRDHLRTKIERNGIIMKKMASEFAEMSEKSFIKDMASQISS